MSMSPLIEVPYKEGLAFEYPEVIYLIDRKLKGDTDGSTEDFDTYF